MTERTRTIWNALVANYDKWAGEWEMMGDAMGILAGVTAEVLIEALDDTDRYIDDVHETYGYSGDLKIRVQLMHVLGLFYPEAAKRWSEAPRPEKVLTEAEKRAAEESRKTAKMFRDYMSRRYN
jgi:hypothetical protein